MLIKDIRRHIKDLEKNIQAKLQEIISKNNDNFQSIVSIRNDRYVIPVNDFKNTIKIIRSIVFRQIVYIEPQIICKAII